MRKKGTQEETGNIKVVWKGKMNLRFNHSKSSPYRNSKKKKKITKHTIQSTERNFHSYHPPSIQHRNGVTSNKLRAPLSHVYFRRLIIQYKIHHLHSNTIISRQYGTKQFNRRRARRITRRTKPPL